MTLEQGRNLRQLLIHQCPDLGQMTQNPSQERRGPRDEENHQVWDLHPVEYYSPEKRRATKFGSQSALHIRSDRSGQGQGRLAKKAITILVLVLS